MESSYFINGGGKTGLTQQVLELISNAKIYIKTANFLFQDKQVINQLEEKMDEGVPLFVISNLRDPEESGQKSSDEGIVVDMHLPNLDELMKMGAHCHFLDELHAKFIIIDGVIGIIMSANYTENSLGKNIETGLIIKGEEVKDLEYVFDKLYSNADVQKFGYIKEEKHVLRKTDLIPADAFDELHSRIRLTISSPEDKSRKKKKAKTNLASCRVSTIYKSIVELINDATEFVIIVSWHFKALSNLPEFMIAVENAIGRGAKVSLYSNCYGQSTSLNSSLEAIKQLETIGCISYGDDNNHSKCVVTEKGGILFTANIDGVHGMTTGFEVGCMLDKEQHCDVVNHVISMISNNKR